MCIEHTLFRFFRLDKMVYSVYSVYSVYLVCPAHAACGGGTGNWAIMVSQVYLVYLVCLVRTDGLFRLFRKSPLPPFAKSEGLFFSSPFAKGDRGRIPSRVRSHVPVRSLPGRPAKRIRAANRGIFLNRGLPPSQNPPSPRPSPLKGEGD